MISWLVASYMVGRVIPAKAAKMPPTTAKSRMIHFLLANVTSSWRDGVAEFGALLGGRTRALLSGTGAATGVARGNSIRLTAEPAISYSCQIEFTG